MDPVVKQYTMIEALFAVDEQIKIEPFTFPVGIVGLPYSYQIAGVSGGKEPYLFELIEGMGNGVTVSQHGLVSGTPTAIFDGAVKIKISSAR